MECSVFSYTYCIFMQKIKTFTLNHMLSVFKLRRNEVGDELGKLSDSVHSIRVYRYCACMNNHIVLCQECMHAFCRAVLLIGNEQSQLSIILDKNYFNDCIVRASLASHTLRLEEEGSGDTCISNSFQCYALRNFSCVSNNIHSKYLLMHNMCSSSLE